MSQQTAKYLLPIPNGDGSLGSAHDCDSFDIDSELQTGFRSVVPEQTDAASEPLSPKQIHQLQTERESVLFQQLWMTQRHDYDAFASPPDFNVAQKHAHAKRVSHLPHKNKEIAKEKCWPCCNFPYESQGFGLWDSSPTSLGIELGCGFSLYYDLIKTLGFMMMICNWFSLFAMIDNYSADKAGEWDEKLDGHFIISGTIAAHGTDSAPSIVQVWLNVVMGWIILVIYVITFYRHMRMVEEIDKKQISPSDYTIFFRGFPKNAKENEIKEWIEEHGLETGKPAIEKINMAYDIDQFASLKRKYVYWLIQSEKRPEKTKWGASKEKCMQKCQYYKEKIEKLLENEVEFSGKAFVTFKWEAEAKICREYLTNPKRELNCLKRIKRIMFSFSAKSFIKFKDKKLQVDRPDEPSDILWENLGERNWFWRRVKSNIVILLILVACGCVIWASSEWKKQMKDDSSNELSDTERTKLRIQAFIPAIIICIINIVLQKVVGYFTQLQKFDSCTAQDLHFSVKLAIAMFINTAIIELIVYRDPDDWYAIDGLIAEVYNIVLANAILSPLLYYLDVEWITKKVTQKYQLHLGDKSKLTQQQANELFEGFQLETAVRTAQLMKTYMLGMFYGPIMPIAYPITALSFFITYWVDKYILLNRVVRPEELGKQLIRNVLRFLPIGVFLNCISAMVFFYDYDSDTLPAVVTGLVVAFVFLATPWQRYIRLKKLLEDAKIDFAKGIVYEPQKSYDQQIFLFDYDRENPIHATNAQKLWLSRLEASGSDDQIQLLNRFYNLKNTASILDKHAKFKSEGVIPKVELKSIFDKTAAKSPIQLLDFQRLEQFKKQEYNAQRNKKQLRKVEVEVQKRLLDTAINIGKKD